MELGNSGEVIDAERVVDEPKPDNSEKTNDEDLKILQDAEKAIEDNLESDSQTIPNPFEEDEDDVDDGTEVDFDFDDE